MLTIDNIFEKHQSVQNSGFTGDAYKPGLARMLAFDSFLGEPWREFRSIHVAGTNGKGSVCSILASVLAANGYKTGLYTSPHISGFRERMRIVGQGMIPENYVNSFLAVYEDRLEPLSFFEITTAMAFKWFAEERVDFAVIETGLGGRLDSTNVIVPELSIITGIGLDHCAILGDTVEKIAFEKAGIFKERVPAVVASREDATARVFEDRASRLNCPLYFANEISGTLDEVSLLERMDLQGPCQKQNLHTALVALSVLGIPADVPAIESAALRTCFRGRWERLCTNPEVICDIGHNPPALAVNFRALEQSGRPLYIVYGVMADKDFDSIAKLMPSQAHYYLCAPQTGRSLGVTELAGRLEKLRPELSFSVADSVADAVLMAVEVASKIADSLVYIGGSTFVVSESLKCF